MFERQILLNFIIENKKYDSFKFVERLDHSFQTKKYYKIIWSLKRHTSTQK